MKVEECHRICMLCQAGDNGEICTMDSSEKTHTVSCGSSVYKQDDCLSKHTVSGTSTATSAVTNIHLLHFNMFHSRFRETVLLLRLTTVASYRV